jgi:saccharopine dehydrogenase (NAD+, L-lysine-forming)
MRVAVLGAGGTIAPAIVADLAASPEIDGLSLLDLSGARAREVASQHGAGKAQAAAVDATDPQALYLALEGHQMLVNAASYRVNLSAMDACLAADCNYLDLGGLYHVTRDQFRLHDAFAERGLVAVLGCGAGPGKTNVMAVHGAAGMSTVERIRCASAGVDLDPPAGLSTPYALDTLIDELTLDPMVVRDGEATAIQPLTEGGAIAFPEPIGTRGSLYTLHSEVLTLASSLGAQACDFRLSLDPALQEVLLGLVDLPRHELRAMRPAPPSPRTYSAQRVELTGMRDGAATTVVVTALTVPDEARGLGGGIVSTASVAAATARLFARGALRDAGFGVHPPESALKPELLFAELEARGCTFTTTSQTQEVRLP